MRRRGPGGSSPQAARLLPAEAVPAPQTLHALGSAPIVTVHLLLDRVVLPGRFTAVSHPAPTWLFDRSEQITPRRGQYLTMPISAAQDWLELPTEQIRRRVLPAIRRAKVLDLFVTRERHATFRQAPGSGRVRPEARTGVPGLVVAGAWVATGWPDTIEGAVRSGETAAELTHAYLHRPAIGRRPPPAVRARTVPADVLAGEEAP